MLRLEQFAIVIWTALALSTNFALLFPDSHWVASGLLLLLLPFTARYSAKDFQIPTILEIVPVLLILSILIVALDSDNVTGDIVGSAKLSILLLVVLPALVSRSARRGALWAGAEVTVYINLCCVLLGLTVDHKFFEVKGIARFGTWTTGPGGLWQVGAIGLATAGMLGQQASRWAKLRQVICALSSVAFIVLDGSRTGLIVLTVACALYVPRAVGGSRRRPLLALAIIVVISAFVSLNLPLLEDFADNYGVLARVQQSLEASGGNVSADALDATRAEMYTAVLSAIKKHPILGTGFGSTKTETESQLMVVHCSFLQIWADSGLLGFLAYSSFIAMPTGASLFFKLRGEVNTRNIASQALYLSFSWLILGFFNPVSTEPSEWVWFTLIVALLGNCYVAASQVAGNQGLCT